MEQQGASAGPASPWTQWITLLCLVTVLANFVFSVGTLCKAGSAFGGALAVIVYISRNNPLHIQDQSETAFYVQLFPAFPQFYRHIIILPKETLQIRGIQS